MKEKISWYFRGYVRGKLIYCAKSNTGRCATSITSMWQALHYRIRYHCAYGNESCERKVASNDFGNVSQRFMFSGALLPLARFFFASFINGSIQRSCTVTSIEANFFSLGDQLHRVLLCSYKIDVYFVFTLLCKQNSTGNMGVCKQA